MLAREVPDYMVGGMLEDEYFDRAVVFTGVHGVGKTTVAKMLADEYGMMYVPVEAIDKVAGLSLYRRQVVFWREFNDVFWDNVFKGSVVMDNHPVAVGAYAYYMGLEYGDKKLEFLGRMMLDAAKHWLGGNVFLLVADPEEIVERIRKRGRENVDEEAMLDYVSVVQDILLREAGLWAMVLDTTGLAPKDVLEVVVAALGW